MCTALRLALAAPHRLFVGRGAQALCLQTAPVRPFTETGCPLPAPLDPRAPSRAANDREQADDSIAPTTIATGTPGLRCSHRMFGGGSGTFRGLASSGRSGETSSRAMLWAPVLEFGTDASARAAPAEHLI